LLSRAAVYVLKPLSAAELDTLLTRAVERQLREHRFSADARKLLIAYADGDARRLLNCLEQIQVAAGGSGPEIDEAFVRATPAQARRQFDKGGEQFYDQISALHKSVRGSDPDAALYWLTRMLDGGADPLYLGRRLVRMATEDIGLADPRALRIALDRVKPTSAWVHPKANWRWWKLRFISPWRQKAMRPTLPMAPHARQSRLAGRSPCPCICAMPRRAC
jgi:putative ATPase